jgi:hypothetical protein
MMEENQGATEIELISPSTHSCEICLKCPRELQLKMVEAGDIRRVADVGQ